MQKTIKSAWIVEQSIIGDFLIPDDENKELRTTVKLCINRWKRTGEGQDTIVFRLLDWCQNCGAEPLAEEILSYVGVNPTREYTFQYTSFDGEYQVHNAHRLPPNQNPNVKMRTYIWKQIDAHPPIFSILTNHCAILLNQLNQGIPYKQRGRFIYNHQNEECYALGPSKLIREGDLNGPPFGMGIALGPNDKELDDDDPYLDQYYWH